MSSGAHIFRFSLTALFGAVLFTAFGTAAIRFASPLWAGLTMALTVPLLFAAILGAVFRLGQARAFWTGMAVCGWGYLLLVMAPWFEAGVGQYLPTTCILNYAHEKLHAGAPMAFAVDVGVPIVTTTGGGTILTAANGGGNIRIWDSATGLPMTAVRGTGPDAGLVLRTGHALFALLFGFLGGVTAKWFYLTRAPRDEDDRNQF